MLARSLNPRTTRLHKRLLLLVVIGSIVFLIAACNRIDSPQSTAQAFADAVVHEEYTEADKQVDSTLFGDSASQREQFFAQYRAGFTKDFGKMTGAVVQNPINQDADSAELLIIWKFGDRAIATVWGVAQSDSRWKMAGVNLFVAQEGLLTDAGLFQTPTPVPATPTPIPSPTPPPPTPSAQDVRIFIPDTQDISRDVIAASTVSLLELKTEKPLGDGDFDFTSVPLGEYTLRLHIPGTADQDTIVSVRGDQKPSVVRLPVGEPLPLDPMTTFLFNSNGALFSADKQYTLATLGDAGITSRWSVALGRIGEWDAVGQQLPFVSNEGIGQIDLLGRITWQWQPDKQRGWHYSPGASEIAYIENKDVFIQPTQLNAPIERLTQVGIFTEVLGWFDRDTLLVRAEDGNRILRRDGSGYVYAEPSIFTTGYARIADPEGVIRFLMQDGTFYQPGVAALEARAAIPKEWGNNGPYSYGWTADGQHLVVHSGATDEGTDSGIFALDIQGVARQITSSLLATPQLFSDGLVNRFGSVAFSSTGGRLALVWGDKTQRGIFVADATNTTFSKVSGITPDALFWPGGETLVYVIKEGTDIGTWVQPLDGSVPTQISKYRADHVTMQPDGRLLFRANKSLWASNGRDTAVLIGKEGTADDTGPFIWFTLPTAVAQNDGVSATPIVPTVSTNDATATSTDNNTFVTTVIHPQQTTASAAAPPSKDSTGATISYNAENVSDGSQDTAWRVDGDGVGAIITLDFGQAIKIADVQLIPGYAKVDQATGVDRFPQNRRIKRVRVTFDDGTTTEGAFVDRPTLQSITISPVITARVIIEILETTAPSANDGRNFTPISEIMVYGQQCDGGCK